MIDFDALVLGPAMAVFARPIVVTPLASQPGVPDYVARGVWQVRPIQVLLEDGQQISTEARTFGLRLSEFIVPPKDGDVISAPPIATLPAVPTHIIDGIDADGQGGVMCTMRQWPA